MGLFDTVKVTQPKKNLFNLSHEVKQTMRIGDLVPIICEPVIPGDKWSLKTDIMLRMAPLVAPMMQRVNVYTHFFFVPSRLVWDNWREFITGPEKPKMVNGRAVWDENAHPYPRIIIPNSPAVTEAGNMQGSSSLADYLGFPVVDENVPDSHLRCQTLDLLPFRAYQLIYNEFYRDQNIDDEIDIKSNEDGYVSIVDENQKVKSDYAELLKIRQRAWEKDYFTSALPWPQRGDDVEIPIISGSVPVDGNVVVSSIIGDKTNVSGQTTALGPGMSLPANGSVSVDSNGKLKDANGTTLDIRNAGELTVRSNAQHDLHVDLSDSISSATINELRRAFSAQKFLETSARVGHRYIEQILGFFGVRSSDARLQRPEYLGGGVQPIQTESIAATADTTNGGVATPLGTLAGNSFSLGTTHGFKRSFEEHGYIIGIMSILPKATYQQGMPRKFSKFDRLDYYWPQFAHLGEQEIKNKEILYCGSSPYGDEHPTNDAVFGYQSRYAEYKYLPSRVCGDFRHNLNSWHMGRIFSNVPSLNGDFIHVQPDSTNRVFAVTEDDVDKVWVDMYHNIKALRPMPYYGTPKL